MDTDQLVIWLIKNDIEVYEYRANHVPSIGDTVKRLHGTIEQWKVKEVIHCIDAPYELRIVLIVE